MQCPKHKERECALGRSRCDECLTQLREYQRKRRVERAQSNRCVGTVTRSKCTNPPRPGKTMCQECADVFNRYQLERIRARKEKADGQA